jgi:hypothetical protein
MVDTSVLPNGKVIIIGGTEEGLSNLDHRPNSCNVPHNEPWIYDPEAPAGRRYRRTGAYTNIARMYHGERVCCVIFHVCSACVLSVTWQTGFSVHARQPSSSCALELTASTAMMDASSTALLNLSCGPVFCITAGSHLMTSHGDILVGGSTIAEGFTSYHMRDFDVTPYQWAEFRCGTGFPAESAGGPSALPLHAQHLRHT